jgi:predicted MFS family arabinose efflux permease
LPSEAPSLPRPGLVGIAALLLAGAMSGVGNGTLSAILPQIEGEFGPGQGVVTITMALTVFGLGILIGSLAGGWLADRIGRRAVMVGAGLLFGVSGCGVIFADALWHVVAGRLGAGISSGAMGAAALAVIGDGWDEKGRNLWTGLFTAFASMSGMALSLVASAIADEGWRNSFAIYGVGFLAAACALLGIARGRRTSTEAGGGAIPLSVVPGLLVFGLLAGGIATGTAAYLPHRMVEAGVATSTERALYMLSGAATVMLVSMAYGWIRRFIRLETAFVLAAAFSCGGLAMMALAPSPVLISTGLGLEGVGLGLLMPSLIVYAIGRSNADNRGRMIGLVKGAVFGGPFLIQFALDPIRVAEGAGTVLLILAAGAAALAGWFVVQAVKARAPQLAGAPGVPG